MPGTFDTIDGTIDDMRQLSGLELVDKRIYRTREAAAPYRESTFAFDTTPYDGPLYDPPAPLDPKEVPFYAGFAPNSVPDGSTGVWRWMNHPAGFTDAEQVYGVSAYASSLENALRLQRCIDEALLSAIHVDSQSGRLLGGRYRVLLPPGDIELDTPIRFHTDLQEPLPGDTSIDNYGGRLILEGHGPISTMLHYVGPSNEHAFMLGGGAEMQAHRGVTRMELKKLTLKAATDPDKAVLYMNHSRGGHILGDVVINQQGRGNGIDAINVYLGMFEHVVVVKTGGVAGAFEGTGFWMRTELAEDTCDEPFCNDIFVSGEFTINRLSVFGFIDEPNPSNSRYWDVGIRIGDAHLSPTGQYDTEIDRYAGGISGQFINVEGCNEGLVIGRDAMAIDFSVVWAERNRRCGVRVYENAQNVTLRNMYMFHAPPYSDPLIFEGDLVLGKEAREPGETADPAWNRYRNVLTDGVFQNWTYGAAVRIYAGDQARNVIVRNVLAILGVGAEDNPYGSRPPENGVPASEGGGSNLYPSGGEVPLVDSLVVLDDEPYQNLVLENIFLAPVPPLPGSSENRAINFPERASLARVAGVDQHAGGNTPTVMYYESERAQPPRGHIVYPSSGGSGVSGLGTTLKPDDPFFHRVDTGSNKFTVTLPLAYNKHGTEFHIMKNDGNEDGSADVIIKSQADQMHGPISINGQSQWRLRDNYSFVHVRWVNEGQFDRGWEVVGMSGPSA